ncbi:hypothetical protein [Streptomyces blattellae]|uniref:hypothetical protein n=1 Tax=Streptomyces blattellae TaxID=2569855 RepID=UPI002E21857C
MEGIRGAGRERGADGDAGVGPGERRGVVVDAVADHGDLAAAAPQLGDLGRFVAREDLGDDGSVAARGPPTASAEDS